MQQRSVPMVVILALMSFGVYGVVWLVKTKEEMNRQGANLPTAWLLVVPFVNIYWLWKYGAGVQHVTRGRTSQVLGFIFVWLLGAIGMAILQDSFNKLGGQAQMPDARAMG